MSRKRESITDETLLGFVMHALPENEMRAIEVLASKDPTLRQRIQDISELLIPLNSTQEEFEPSGDLAASTMAAIGESTQSVSRLGALSDGMSDAGFESSKNMRLAWLDSLVTLVAGIVILSFLLPSVWISRESARRVACASNLRQLGEAITAFAYGNPGSQIPRIDMSGPLSFAGVIPMRLRDAGLLDSASITRCPSKGYIVLEPTIPTTSTYLAAAVSAQNNWRYSVGGNYSYNLGNVISGVYVTPSLDSDYFFAVVGDSLCSPDIEQRPAPIHGRNAANLLYSDGSVHYMRIDGRDSDQIDNPYLNRVNQQAVGFGIEDCCLGPGFQFPLMPILID